MLIKGKEHRDAMRMRNINAPFELIEALEICLGFLPPVYGKSYIRPIRRQKTTI